MRIGGIASGMDTESMVQNLMRAERLRIDRFFQQEQRLKWRQEAFNNINRSMANFILDSRKAFGLTTVSNTGTMLSRSAQSFNWVKKAASSNESVVKATANASAMPGTHKIQVEQLAEVASVASTRLTDTILNADGTFKEYGTFEITTKGGKKEITIADAKVEGSKVIEAPVDFTEQPLIFMVNNTPVELTGNYTSLEGEEGLIEAIQKKLGESITVDLDHEGKLVMTSKQNINITAIEGDLSVLGLNQGSTLATNTIDSVVRELNSTADVNLGIRAAYDKDLGRLMITTRETGEEQHITIGGTEELVNKMFGIDAVHKTGQDAIIYFNDESREQPINKSTNNFSIFGINLQLQGTDPGKEITIHVESDVDSIFDKVKSFVDEYNKMIDMVNGQLGEKYYRDFSPLTNEQKESMSEKDIELWEEKAKSGLLRNDSTLTRTLQTMRSNLYERVEGVTGSYNHITQIGITTGAYQSGGKLVIDEEKLRKAINDDPEGVVDLLFKTPDASITDDKEKMKNTGLVQRIYDGMIDGIKEVIRQSGPGEDAALLRNVRSNILIDFVTAGSQSVLDKDLSGINSRIAREEMLLAKREERYWQQFTAMEKALSQMNQQSAWLMSQLGQQQY
ncbi:flagellar hook-associated protein 2 FliD [Clostridium aceticum]|uniref:Flagellar hook-associated protein 2 n=1 Tax=Clostridium aceticum TaxID=84022 RepID=A0A0G3W543_9CLOT|nr:flagellar filament capping protein FliD [Clostridium aceticum]AKL93816.1 flagellar hook-associated protein 2 FliD [Clostridium aceticum]